MTVSIEAFTKLVRQHDITHMYSDDASVWRRGADELAVIREMAAKLPREEVVRIWNENIDRCMSEGFREGFYWK